MAKSIFHGLTICLFATLLFVSNAHATSSPPPSGGGAASGGGTASETCIPEVRQELEVRKYNHALQKQEVIRGVYQPHQSSADTTCLGEQLLSGGKTAGESFSDNVEDFCNDIKCDQTMDAVLSEGTLATLATFLSSNPMSDPSSVVGLIGNLAGFGGFSECNGIENLYKNTLGKNIPFEVVAGGGAVAGAIGGAAGGIGGGLQGILGNVFDYDAPEYRPVERVSEPIESRGPAEGECKRVETVGGGFVCIPGPRTVCNIDETCSVNTRIRLAD